MNLRDQLQQDLEALGKSVFDKFKPEIEKLSVEDHMTAFLLFSEITRAGITLHVNPAVMDLVARIAGDAARSHIALFKAAGVDPNITKGEFEQLTGSAAAAA